MAQAASYCPTHPHLYRYLGRRLGGYTLLQPLLSIRPREGVQVSGELGAQGSTFPLLKIFLDCAGVFPFGVCHQGFFPLGLLPPTGLVPFLDKRGLGDLPLESPFSVPGTHPTPFERLGMRDLRPPLGSTCTKVGSLLQGCTIVVAATHGGGAAAP